MFKQYVYVGDTVKVEHNGLTFVVNLYLDDDCTPLDYECYSDEVIQAWRDGDWFFGGLVVDVYIGDFLICNNAAALWGIDCNSVTSDNNHLNREMNNLIDEASESIKPIVADLITKLTTISGAVNE